MFVLMAGEERKSWKETYGPILGSRVLKRLFTCGSRTLICLGRESKINDFLSAVQLETFVYKRKTICNGELTVMMWGTNADSFSAPSSVD
jgi:hypothetical protein